MDTAYTVYGTLAHSVNRIRRTRSYVRAYYPYYVSRINRPVYTIRTSCVRSFLQARETGRNPEQRRMKSYKFFRNREEKKKSSRTVIVQPNNCNYRSRIIHYHCVNRTRVRGDATSGRVKLGRTNERGEDTKRPNTYLPTCFSSKFAVRTTFYLLSLVRAFTNYNVLSYYGISFPATI